MTPKEKAEQLVDKYRNTIMSFLSDNMKDMKAKQCALIAVDEIIYTLNVLPYGMEYLCHIDYYEEVKQEIESL